MSLSGAMLPGLSIDYPQSPPRIHGTSVSPIDLANSVAAADRRRLPGYAATSPTTSPTPPTSLATFPSSTPIAIPARSPAIPTYEEATSPVSSPLSYHTPSTLGTAGQELGVSIGTEGNRLALDAFGPLSGHQRIEQIDEDLDVDFDDNNSISQESDRPPIYSPYLADDETRLFSNVHLDRSHPSAAAFTQAAEALQRPAPPIPGMGEQRTGNKKMQIVITSGAHRLNTNGTGPLYIRIGREGKLEGRVEIGKTDKVTSIEVAVLGFVNTSYFVRGQYMLMDTVPLARRTMKLFPPGGILDPQEADASPTRSSPDGSPAGSANPLPDDTVPTTSSNAAANPVSSTSPTAPTHSPPGTSEISTMTVGKDTFLAPLQTLPFCMTMPTSHYREKHTELPPTAQVFQVGMQMSIEYVLRVKMSRKGWRMAETSVVPIVYEPRGYVSPRRVTALTTNDPLNPGWRTIRLRGGQPKVPEGAAQTDRPGVTVDLLLPSPPILFCPYATSPPAIPFHLHFTSTSILPLATFSDPTQCTYIIRLVRVTTLHFGDEKEIRRLQIPSKVELWQDEGPRYAVRSEEPDSNGLTRTISRTRRASFTPSVHSENSRLSFFRRRSSTVQPPTPPAASLAEAVNNLTGQVSNIPTNAEMEETERLASPAPLVRAPLSMDATDVHLMGHVKLNVGEVGDGRSKGLIQSFSTPEIAVTYVLEVGLQPKNGAVKEAFAHVWGGGLIEVVLGPKP